MRTLLGKVFMEFEALASDGGDPSPGPVTDANDEFTPAQAFNADFTDRPPDHGKADAESTFAGDAIGLARTPMLRQVRQYGQAFAPLLHKELDDCRHGPHGRIHLHDLTGREITVWHIREPGGAEQRTAGVIGVMEGSAARVGEG